MDYEVLSYRRLFGRFATGVAVVMDEFQARHHRHDGQLAHIGKSGSPLCEPQAEW
jgi:hypothetical protein